MVSNELAKQLHDKATRGKSLSVEENALLKDWYALQDSAESDVLGLRENEETLTTLQAQVEEMLAQLTVATKRIQNISSENEALKREIAHLRQQLVHQPVPQLV